MSRTYQIFVYPLQGKVLFPYHERQVTITSNKFDAKDHNYLIGFVTRVDPELQNVDVIAGVSRYGTLMRIQKVDRFESIPDTEFKTNRFTVSGLTFARFRITQMAPQGVGFQAKVQILTDQIPSNQEIFVQETLFQRLKAQLISFYQFTCSPGEAELMRFKIQSQHRISKLVFSSMCDLSLSVEKGLLLLSLGSFSDRISTLLQHVASITGSDQGGPDSSIRQLNHHGQNTSVPDRPIKLAKSRVDNIQELGANSSHQGGSPWSQTYSDRVNYYPQISRNERQPMPKF